MITPSIAPPFPVRCAFTGREDAWVPPRLLSQVHGTDILKATEHIQEGDGLWTSDRRHPIGVRVADCTPILLAGPLLEEPWIACLHAGWRGAVGGGGSGASPGILRAAIALFRNAGGRPQDLWWALGPAIQVCHFEVGEEVLDAARKDRAWREDFARPGLRGRPHLDLAAFLRAQAMEMGLDPEKDGSVSRCTFCEPESFFSYRRGDKEGRQWGWIEIL